MLMTCFIESCEYVDGICTRCHLTEDQKKSWLSMNLDQQRSISTIVKWEKQQKRPKKKTQPFPPYIPVFVDET